MSPFGGFPGMPKWEETPGKTQNSLEGLYIPSGMEMIPQEDLELIDVRNTLLSHRDPTLDK